jgi:hypothetical protein
MLKRSLLLVLAVPLTACSTLETRDYAPGTIPPPTSDSRISAVTRNSGERVAFDREADGDAAPRAWFDREVVVGPVNGEAVRFDLSETRSVSVEESRIHVGRSILLAGGVAVATLYGVAAIAMSTAGW